MSSICILLPLLPGFLVIVGNSRVNVFFFGSRQQKKIHRRFFSWNGSKNGLALWVATGIS